MTDQSLSTAKPANQSELEFLRAENAQLLMLLERGESGAMHADAQGRIIRVNQALRSMFAIDDYGLENLTLTAFEKNLVAMLDSKEPVKLPITALITILDEMDGAVASPISSTVFLAAPRRAVIQIKASVTRQRDLIFYFRDITAEFDVDRMKSEFLSTAAHELRTPLASIFGFAEIMIARVLKPEVQRELLQTIHRQAKILINMINELLDLSRIESRQGKDFHRQHCRVENVIKIAIQGLFVPGDRRQVTVNLPHGRERILVDAEKTSQAVLNLLSNAFKFSPRGGAIVLETLLHEEDGDREVGIRVTDRGLGMSPQDSERVFERFFRAEATCHIPGTGLGMSLVKEITELQDGRVQVESILGEGTSVTLWFPLASDFLLSRPFPLTEM